MTTPPEGSPGRLDARVIAANIEVHTVMASRYETAEPHYRPENRNRVRRDLAELRARTGPRLLDLGCGTGFIIDQASGLFDQIHGVDITPAMLERVRRSPGVQLHRALAEQLPFRDGSFDLVTAYSFIHHTKDYWWVLSEAARVLRRGGICYVDLEPNEAFWRSMISLTPGDDAGLSSMVKRARDSVTATDAAVERDYGIPQATFRLAEYSKAELGGIDGAEIVRRAPSLGFSHCTVRPWWFVGQAEVMHGQSFEQADRIEEHLRALSPLGDHLFKYLRIDLVR